jgi:hypothetical protein
MASLARTSSPHTVERFQFLTTVLVAERPNPAVLALLAFSEGAASTAAAFL